MPTDRQKQTDRKTIIDKIYEELKNINWEEINSKTQKNIQIGLVGTKTQIAQMKKWLGTTDYKLYRRYGVPLKNKPDKNRINNHTIEIVVSKNKINTKLVRNSNFCIVVSKYHDLVREMNQIGYVFDRNKKNIPIKALSDFTEHSFALSYNFPAFRYSHSHIEINGSAIQNMFWAMGTAAPNVIPGGHQVVSAPIEAISDFTVLTLNEIKMLFELVGISGYIVIPYKCLVEFGITIGGALIAQNTGTNVVGKMPAGAGIAMKGGVAFAFTYAIGEAVYFYLQTGQQATTKFIDDRVEHWGKTGKKMAKEVVSKKGKK